MVLRVEKAGEGTLTRLFSIGEVSCLGNILAIITGSLDPDHGPRDAESQQGTFHAWGRQNLVQSWAGPSQAQSQSQKSTCISEGSGVLPIPHPMCWL